MKLYSEERVREWTNQRVRANLRAGRPPGPESSIGKVHQGDLNQRVQVLATDPARHERHRVGSGRLAIGKATAASAVSAVSAAQTEVGAAAAAGSTGATEAVEAPGSAGGPERVCGVPAV